MCIIVSKEKGVKLPTKKILENCFKRNSDGAGFMYVKNNQVMIDKGYMTFEDFYKRLKELKKEFGNDLTDKALVMHFRIGTHGNNDKETTHPFPVSSSESELRKLKTTTNVGMAHNGIIPYYGYYTLLSDTQAFIKDYVSVFRDLDKQFYKNERVMQLIKKTASSKLCFLDNQENIYYLGDFVENEGVKYSNDTYKPYDPYSYSYSYYPWYSANMNKNTSVSTSANTTKKASNYAYNDLYYYDDYYTEYGKSAKYTELLEIEDYLSTHKDYRLLDVGEYYEENGDIYEVADGDILIYNAKTKRLYEWVNGDTSLLATDIKVYDEFEFNTNELINAKVGV